jgi:hypothetical protein
MAFSRHTEGGQSPSERLCLYPDSGSLTLARNLVRGSQLDVLSATLPQSNYFGRGNPSHIEDFEKLLVSQCDYRVDTHCPPRGDITGRKRHTCEH